MSAMGAVQGALGAACTEIANTEQRSVAVTKNAMIFFMLEPPVLYLFYVWEHYTRLFYKLQAFYYALIIFSSLLL
jgi:hypothetical protein